MNTSSSSQPRHPVRPSEIRTLLQELNFAPSKTLGQNFLTDENILRIIGEQAEVQPTDHVLEIGPGLGALTYGLVQQAGDFVAVEKDDNLHAFLTEQYKEQGHCCIIHADALDINWDELEAFPFDRVVSNLPYSVGNRILVRLLEYPPLPKRIVVTVQKDVADRMVAPHGTRTYGLLSILLQADYSIRTAHTVSPGCFLPPPRVSSAVVVLDRRNDPIQRTVREHGFRDLVKWCFTQRRKQLGVILRKAPHSLGLPPNAIKRLSTLGIEPQSRPETLTPEQWGQLSIELFDKDQSE